MTAGRDPHHARLAHRSAGAVAMMILILLFRPRGLMGTRET